MRPLFTLRFIAAVAALIGLVLFVNTVIVDEQSLEAVVDPDPVERRIDLIAPVFSTQRSADFEMDRRGVSSGFIDLVLDGGRTVRAAPGTLGEITCEEVDAINRCALFADLLGDAVVWFALAPQAARSTAELPPVEDLQDGYAVRDNGWQIRYPPVIERECGSLDIPSFTDFLRNYREGSTTVVDLATQEVVAVRCAP